MGSERDLPDGADGLPNDGREVCMVEFNDITAIIARTIAKEVGTESQLLGQLRVVDQLPIAAYPLMLANQLDAVAAADFMSDASDGMTNLRFSRSWK